MARYLIVIEPGKRNYSAYAPDVPGCVATGKTRDEVINTLRAALAFHIEGMHLHGEPIPEPATRGIPKTDQAEGLESVFVEVDVPASV